MENEGETLKRLEREIAALRYEAAVSLAEQIKGLAEAIEKRRREKTPGERIARMILSVDHAAFFMDGYDQRLAKAIDAEIDKAKREQREKDAKVALGGYVWRSPRELSDLILNNI